MSASGWEVAPGGALQGEVVVPGDKSISHRSLMLGAIATGRTEVTGFLASEDCLATRAALGAMGVAIESHSPTHLFVEGVGRDGLQAPSGTLDMGNAGTAMRLFMGLLCGRPFDTTLVGDASLMRRPMERVAKPLREMGAVIETREGRPPVLIRGGRPLQAIDFRMPMASAQVKSAVLLAALSARGRSCVTEPAPTRDHTERMLAGFGVQLLRSGNRVELEGGQALRAARIAVPGDFSSAAFFMVAACIGGGSGLMLRNVGINPTRTGLLDMLLSMGADIRVHRHAGDSPEPVADIEVRPGALRGIAVPEALVPLAIDEFPIFFIAAACADGETLVRGAEELRVKESDRLATMAAGLAALGVEHELLPDGIRIRGRPGPVAAFGGGRIDSHGDHRIAMSFAVAALRAAAPIRIDDTANVATSFPGFAALARSVGLGLRELA
ncbi:MAG: 3-phosphoshikimate 1-carboxyvinyltransferase [Steroidobacteraceae bacterium]|nr:3-phosphoshikimate 1-carboxyvinyltransferase [Nevskiaceae bacterium]MCP5359939.1 3-phosphoshikimate 1-carboxyvinyltransferase [Nevskiaceae bacterium]